MRARARPRRVERGGARTEGLAAACATPGVARSQTSAAGYAWTDEGFVRDEKLSRRNLVAAEKE